MATDLPIHFRTGLRAVGIVNGHPVWPVLGGDESEDAAAQAAAKATSDAAAKAAADAKAAEGDKGYPENTPVVEMTDKQQAAYYKAQARKHEDRNKAIGLTAEQVAELRAKADKHDAMERELMSDNEKKVAEASDAAKAAARAEFLPQIVNARLEAAAAGKGISSEGLAKALEFVDATKFVAADGSVDTAKVSEFIDGIAPATGNNGQQPLRRGPSPSGQGNRGSSSTGVSVASGRELYQQRHPAKK